MAETILYARSEPLNYFGQPVDPNDQYIKFGADVTHLWDDEVCGDLLGFEDGTIKTLPVNLDHHRHSLTSTTTSEKISSIHNVTKSLLMSNAPGHGSTFEIDGECEIQPIYESPPSSFFATPFLNSPHETPPYVSSSGGGGYVMGLGTPGLSPSSSTLTNASSLPTGTPPPVISLYSPAFYDTPTGNLSYAPYPVGYNYLHHDNTCADSLEITTISPKDLMKDSWEPSDSRWDHASPGDHNYDQTPASPASTAVFSLQDLQYQSANPFDPPREPELYRPLPPRPYPTRTSTPLVQLGDDRAAVAEPNVYSNSPALSFRSSLGGGSRTPNVTAVDSALNSHSPGLLPLRDVETPHIPLGEAIPPRPLSPKKLDRFIITLLSDEESDDDDLTLSDVPPRNITRKKRRKAAVRGHNQRFFCSWTGCRASFTRFYDQTRHEAKHNGGKEVCRICGDILSRKDSLTRHMAKMHRDVDLEKDSDQDA